MLSMAHLHAHLHPCYGGVVVWQTDLVCLASSTCACPSHSVLRQGVLMRKAGDPALPQLPTLCSSRRSCSWDAANYECP